MNMLDFDYDNSEHIIYDDKGKRYVKCDFCNVIADDGKFSMYGGNFHVNKGICRLCNYDIFSYDYELSSSELDIYRLRDIQGLPVEVNISDDVLRNFDNFYHFTFINSVHPGHVRNLLPDAAL